MRPTARGLTHGLFIMMARLNNLWQNVSFCLVIQASMLPATLAAKCYFTDGTEATNEMQPCFPEKANSACCSINKSGNQTNDICTSTGLCLAQVSPYTGFFILDACTDESWGSDCPQLNKTLCPIGMNFCNIWTLESIPPIWRLQGTTIKESFGIHVLPCPKVEGGLNHWCCSSDGSDCCDKAFLLDVGTLILSNAPSRNISSSTTQALTTMTVTASPGSSSDKGSKSDPDTTTIGIGVGLGACLAGMIGAVIFQKRVYQKRLRELEGLKAPPTFNNCTREHLPVYPTELPNNSRPLLFELGGNSQAPQ